MSFVLGIVLFALGIIASIALHEWGHLTAARLCGMRVRRYFIGFGPRVFSFRRVEKRTSAALGRPVTTEYGLKAFPLGGFCDIAGMTINEELGEDDKPFAMVHKRAYQRIIVLLGGIAMNIVLGVVILYAVVVTWGAPNPNPDLTMRVQSTQCVPAVQDLRAGSAGTSADSSAQSCTGAGPAASAGIQAGDEIIAVDGTATPTYRDVTDALQTAFSQQTGIGTERTPAGADSGATSADASAGSTASADASTTSAESSATSSSVTPADSGATSSSTTSAESSTTTPQAHAMLTVRRDGQELQIDVPIQAAQRIYTDGSTQTVGMIGITRAPVPNPVVHANALTGIPMAFQLTGEMISQGVTGVLHLPQAVPGLVRSITGAERDANTPVSVVGASVAGGELAEHSQWPSFLALLASLNIFLAVFNLVPLPPLDGGHIAVVLYEVIRDRLRRARGLASRGPVDYRTLTPVTLGFFAVLLAFGGLVILVDIVNPISLFK